MQRAIAAYAAGIRARSVSDMQRAFPAMSASVQRNWSALFSAVRDIDAQTSDIELTPTGAGDGGGATLSLAVSFPNPANRRPCTQVTQLRLRLARAGATWHIVSLEQTGSTSSPGCNG
ncbi:hypothetical protein J421_1665 [Gemmatirosa kalamazoonensis]|uniref:SnoaL-like domain-containing protein n=1 Tax=Gemmatirosa kalamazoonensis TaxID=861299 RepID=W0RFL7_9BACT|nr:hypothetical protein [Gemmatirosa kalamazoonensis]AHG89202.1 hypothetical protein J421_1665 [Gemmatirosa kalamazoonensis]